MSELKFPEATSTVRVHLIDTTTRLTIRSEVFVRPAQQGHEIINCTDVAFLIENEKTGKRVLFDSGCRKDYWNLPVVIQKRLGDVIPSLSVEKDVSEVLEENGVKLDSIDSIIWSHYHWDHTGNASLFPASTSLTVGPGFKAQKALFPGYPEVHESPLSASDFKDRQLNEINFDDYTSQSFLEIGGFRAHDFFGDGSFYLLETPGHCVGHMCGLARVTDSKAPLGSTFVFMGGDIAHFGGAFRPSEGIPLPDPIPEGVLDEAPRFPIPCPAAAFTDLHPRFTSNVPNNNRRDDGQQSPWYQISTIERSGYVDPATAQESVDKMQAFDDSSDVLVCIAHDPTLLEYLPTFNKEGAKGAGLKDFKEKGWKEKVHWGWLNELPRDGKPGRPPIVEGFWRNGKKWDRGEDGKGGKL